VSPRQSEEWVREEIVALTQSGRNAREIAERLRISERTVQRVRAASGCAELSAPRLTGSEILTAMEMLEDGASYGEVARTLGRAEQTISRNIPGYFFSKEQKAVAAALGRAMARLERVQR
jgi:DNA-binding CsgD family transcriptional regulator